MPQLTKEEAKNTKRTFLHKVFGIMESPPPTSTPPPYTDVQPIRTRKIEASATPQWRWSHNQCKEWLTSVLVEYCSLSEYEAQRKAQRFTGFGPQLFRNNTEDWSQLLGRDISGSVFALIFSLKDEPGAKPSNIMYPHYQKIAIYKEV